MDKYDGWVVKNMCGRFPWLVTGYFHGTKKEVIEDFEKDWGKGKWKEERRKGHFNLVKVKLVEVK